MKAGKSKMTRLEKRRRPSDSTTSMPMSAWGPLLGGFQHHHFGALLRRRILWPTEPTVICRRCWYWQQSKMRTLHVLMLSIYVATGWQASDTGK